LPDSIITEEFLTQIAKELSNIKFKGGIHIVDEIPRTNSIGNKVHRVDARKLAVKLINMKQI
jgi:protein subunit release factor A